MRAASGAARLLLAGGCVMATLSAAPVPAAETFTGTIIDRTCADGGHAQMRMGPTDAECTRLCVMFHDDVYVLLVGREVYLLSDQKRPADFAGQQVTVVGTLDAKTKTITVDSIAAAKPPA